MQKVGKANIFAKRRKISDVLDQTMFLATDLTSCFKMIPLWFFPFLLQHLAFVLRERRKSK